jgi:hypothetical protein
MPALLNLPQSALQRKLTFGISEDFMEFVSGDIFTDTSADSGAAVANVDQAGGVVTLSSIAIDNNECYLLSTKELFLFAANKPILASCCLAFAQGSTNAINVQFGLCNAVGANNIVDNGAGPKTNASAVMFECRDGETQWRAFNSLSTTQVSTLLSATNSLDKTGHTSASGATTFQWLDIEVIPYNATNQKVNYYINDVLVYSYDMVYTSATEMALFVGLKLGSATIETVSVDYLGAWQKR